MIKKRIAAIVLVLCMIFTGTAFADTTVGNTPIIVNPGSGQTPATGPGVAAEAAKETQAAAETQNTQETQTAAGGRTIDPSKPMVALTFDDGPCTGPGNRIIDVFLKYGQRCTFFVVGDRLSSRTDELKRLVDNGFEIGNHSYDHKYFNKLTTEEIKSEISKCNDSIKKYAGVAPTIMRLPGGTKSKSIIAAVNMPIILWNVDTQDWKTKNADSSVKAVIGKVKDGDVILMHELYYASAEAAERIVPELVAQGFQLVTVSELAKYKGKELKASTVYYSF